MSFRLPLALALAAGLAAPLGTQAFAAMSAGAHDVQLASMQNAQFERVQFVFGGRDFCWYLSGWHGPGWYWCGYAWRNGFGWGGGEGWNGWRRPGWNGGNWQPHRDWRHQPHGNSHVGVMPQMNKGPAHGPRTVGHGSAGGHGNANGGHWPH